MSLAEKNSHLTTDQSSICAIVSTNVNDYMKCVPGVCARMSSKTALL
jgi:hypothetical protein